MVVFLEEQESVGCLSGTLYELQPERDSLLYLAEELLQAAGNNSLPAAAGGVGHTERAPCRHERREQGLFCYCSY